MLDHRRAPLQRPADASLPSVVAELRALLHQLPRMVSDRVRLATLELHRARNALATMVVLTIAAALMLATAWFALCGTLAALAVEHGISWVWAAAVVALVNAGVAAAIAIKVLALGRLLTLPATLRQLGAGDAEPAANPAPTEGRP